jgi:hypothetical protein
MTLKGCDNILDVIDYFVYFYFQNYIKFVYTSKLLVSRFEINICKKKILKKIFNFAFFYCEEKKFSIHFIITTE